MVVNNKMYFFVNVFLTFPYYFLLDKLLQALFAQPVEHSPERIHAETMLL